jgi:hypothetical protein
VTVTRIVIVIVPAPAPPPPSPPPAPEPSGPLTSFDDGTYLVGEDIVAGNYKTAGPDAGGIGVCYWDTKKGDDFTGQDVKKGPTRATLRKGETFSTSGCQEWQAA